MFVDRAKVMARVDKKLLKVLARTGAYAQQVMRRQLKPPLKRETRDRVITVHGKQLNVPTFGVVTDAKGRPVNKKLADRARAIKYEQYRRRAGQPPRRGPSDLLRKYIFFGVDNDSVVIGPLKFGSQPKLQGAVSVPQLLEQGGGEFQHGVLSKYDPHPFVKPVKPIAEKKMAELLEAIRL